MDATVEYLSATSLKAPGTFYHFKCEINAVLKLDRFLKHFCFYLYPSDEAVFNLISSINEANCFSVINEDDLLKVKDVFNSNKYK